MRIALVLLAAGSLSLTGCGLETLDWGGERFTSDFRFTYPLSNDATMSIENSNGAIEISGWDQNTVEITGSKYARTERLRDEIKIEISHSSSSVFVRTVYPFERGGNMGARYIIRVPRKVRLEHIVSTNGSIRLDGVEGAVNLRTSNGSVHAARITGNLEAQTTNGAIEAADIAGGAHLHTSNGHVRADSIAGEIEASSSNGGIRIHQASADAHGGVRLSTSNGSIEVTLDSQPKSDLHATTTNGGITLRMPSETAAHISADTSHHPIESDFDITAQGRMSKSHLEGSIGNPGSGGPTIDLSTTNGHIQLQRL